MWTLLEPLFAQMMDRDKAWEELGAIWDQASRIGVMLLSKASLFSFDFPPISVNSHWNQSSMMNGEPNFNPHHYHSGHAPASVRLAMRHTMSLAQCYEELGCLRQKIEDKDTKITEIDSERAALSIANEDIHEELAQHKVLLREAENEIRKVTQQNEYLEKDILKGTGKPKRERRTLQNQNSTATNKSMGRSSTGSGTTTTVSFRVDNGRVQTRT